MHSEYAVRSLREDEYDRWTQFVAKCPSGSLFALPVYLDILCQATGGRFEVTGVFRGNELVGGVALYFDDQAVATQLVLTGPHRISYTVCAGSDAGYLATGANPFLRWRSFTALAGLGYHTNDLTGAPYPHELSRFKGQLGGTLLINWRISRTPTFAFCLRRKAFRLVRQFGRRIR